MDDSESGSELEGDGPSGDDAELDLGSGDESSDPEDEQPAVRPYMALMQSLNGDGSREAKRRKLGSSQLTQDTEPLREPLGELGEDVDEDDDLDKVEELDQEAEDAADEIVDGSDDEQEDSLDPFETHFGSPEESVEGLVKAVESNDWSVERTTSEGYRTLWMTPKVETNNGPKLPAPVSSPGDLVLKRRLVEIASKKLPTFDPTEKALSSLLFNYRDVLFCGRTVGNSDSLRQLVCLHAVNHIFK